MSVEHCELCNDTGSIEVADEGGWTMAPCPHGCVGWLTTDMQSAAQDEDEYV